MNKRILLSSVSLFASLALVTGATYAFFSDVGTSVGNTFAAGSFDLRLSDNNENAEDVVDTTWSSTTMAPGANPVTATLQLRNVGTIAGNHIHVRADNVISDINDNQVIAMDSLLEITAATYGGADILPLIPNSNANAIKDLDDLEAAGVGPQIGALADLNVDHPLELTIQLHSSADDTYQGDSVTTTFTATLHQDASQ